VCAAVFDHEKAVDARAVAGSRVRRGALGGHPVSPPPRMRSMGRTGTYSGSVVATFRTPPTRLLSAPSDGTTLTTTVCPEPREDALVHPPPGPRTNRYIYI